MRSADAIGRPAGAGLVLAVAVAAAAPAAGEPLAGDSSAAAYMARCATCHGMHGKTQTRLGRVLKVAPFAGDARLAAMTPAAIARLVKANPKHRGVAQRTDAEIDAAVLHVHRLAQGG